MKIPPQIILKFLKTNFNIKESPSGEVRINSPFANDNKYHCYININKGVVNDFKTGKGSDFISFVSEYLQVQRSEVVKILVRDYYNRNEARNIFSFVELIDKVKNLELPEGLTFFGESKDGVIRNVALSYLKNRKVPEEVIEELGYIYNPMSEYDKRIFIPFYEEGKLVYFIARDFTGKSLLRYSNPKEFNSKEFVYNIDKIDKEVFIFEGVFDALMLKEQIGTAMLSADLGKKQAVKILSKAPEVIVFVPDNDETGKKTLDRNIKLLLKYKPPSINPKIYVFENYPKGCKDFAEAGRNSIDIERDCVEWKRFMFAWNIKK